MKKFTLSFVTIISILSFLGSCSNEEKISNNEIIDGGDKMFVSLTNEEALSLASNNSRTLSDDEVLKAITAFEQKNNKNCKFKQCKNY